MADLDLLMRLKQWYNYDIDTSLKWRSQAIEDFNFYNGDQWSDRDLSILNAQRRPVMTFNRVAPIINAVIGTEINNRRGLHFVPRELGDAISNELLSSAAEWFRDHTNAENEESAAFYDALICGMGWISTSIDFENNPDGDPLVNRLDPLKMAWDCRASKANLMDAQRLWYIDQKPLSQLQMLFPDVNPEDFDASWASKSYNPPINHTAGLYAIEEVEADKLCTIVECRWFDYETFYRGRDILTGQLQHYTAEEAARLRTSSPHISLVRQVKKVARRAFLGENLLQPVDTPLVPAGSLGWNCITAYSEKAKKGFYGLVRPMKDPQRWCNKFFSQIMHLLNSQTKGGILAERGAFEDDRQAAESLAKTDQITWLRNGALSGGAAKVQPKPVPHFPSGFFDLFNETKSEIEQVTGVSAEFLGTRAVNQAGVLEAQRRQSSLNILGNLFDNLKLYRKEQGKIILYLLQHYLSDGRLIRIVGAEKARYIELTREQFATVDYDIVVDDAPTSLHEKERTFALFQELLPVLQPYLSADTVVEFLRYSPFPSSLVEKLRLNLQLASAPDMQ